MLSVNSGYVRQQGGANTKTDVGEEVGYDLREALSGQP